MEIAEEMTEPCPNAWLINFTNPVGMVTEALIIYSNHKNFIGLCNVPIGMERGIAGILDIESNRVRINFAGLNHMVFGFDIFIDDENKTEEVFEKYIDSSIDVNIKNIEPIGWNKAFLKALKLMENH